MENEIDYTAMDDRQLRKHCGGSAREWAHAFCQFLSVCGTDLDSKYVERWFDQAICEAWNRGQCDITADEER